MSAKKVTCGTKPTPQAPAAASADQWVVASRTRETIKRLTLDIPASLHMRIKSTCALHPTGNHLVFCYTMAKPRWF